MNRGKKQAEKPKRRPYRPPAVVTAPIFERMALMCGQKPGSADCARGREAPLT